MSAPHTGTQRTPQKTCSAPIETLLTLQCGEPHWEVAITAFKGNKTSAHPGTQRDGQDLVEAHLPFPKLAPFR